MKKMWIGITAIILIMGIGTAGAYAATADNDNNSGGSVGKMLQHAKQMHPNLSEKEIQQMHDNCNAKGSAGMTQMMQSSQGMMNF
ncbi:FAD/FMN-containing dehydrogenase [Paenibacillus sp. sgz500958]|uniref:FAD/FMN-containing dehydrogenase n=1 Tax=Paenibacillus sp. sgz500958 TaxID=3242475 RepID=UPI0036D2D75B